MRSGMAQVDDGELYYEVDGEGPPVVLLHGGALDSTMWDDEFALLAAEHTVVRYDARSHGRSSAAKGDFRAYDDLAAVLRHLDIVRPVLVGHSLGGRTSVDFAIAHPDVPAKLVLVGAGVSGMTFVDPYIVDCQRAQAEAIAAGDVEGFVEAIVRAWVDGPRRPAHEVPPAVRQRCRQMVRSTVLNHTGATGEMRELGAHDRLAELRAPVLTLVGDLDSDDIHRIADRIATTAPDARKILVEGAAHMINLERPDEFREILRVI